MSNRISEHFLRSEFACYDNCGFDVVDKELNEVLEDLRWYFNSPVNITRKGGCRCTQANSDAGGAKRSQHLYGKAADIYVSGIVPEKIYRYLDNKYNNKYGMGNAKTFTHIDVREDKKRWSYKKKKN